LKKKTGQTIECSSGPAHIDQSENSIDFDGIPTMRMLICIVFLFNKKDKNYQQKTSNRVKKCESQRTAPI
jgi:hypothetical protein